VYNNEAHYETFVTCIRLERESRWGGAYGDSRQQQQNIRAAQSRIIPDPPIVPDGPSRWGGDVPCRIHFRQGDGQKWRRRARRRIPFSPHPPPIFPHPHPHQFSGARASARVTAGHAGRLALPPSPSPLYPPSPPPAPPQVRPLSIGPSVLLTSSVFSLDLQYESASLTVLHFDSCFSS
jgi:hypothetical protein